MNTIPYSHSNYYLVSTLDQFIIRWTVFVQLRNEVWFSLVLYHSCECNSSAIRKALKIFLIISIVSRLWDVIILLEVRPISTPAIHIISAGSFITRHSYVVPKDSWSLSTSWSCTQSNLDVSHAVDLRGFFFLKYRSLAYAFFPSMATRVRLGGPRRWYIGYYPERNTC